MPHDSIGAETWKPFADAMNVGYQNPDRIDEAPPHMTESSDFTALNDRMRALETALGHLISILDNQGGAMNRNNDFFATLAERTLLLQGTIAGRQLPQGRIANLAAAEFRVFSQWGEDGILEWLIQNVPMSCNRFVEFGVQTFLEANCRYLLLSRNWKGLVMDGDESSMTSLATERLYWRHDLTARCAFVTADNINTLLTENGFGGDLGILSIDIDGNDYWVWEKISVVTPAIIICEYNSVFGDRHAVTVPYNPAFSRLEAHHSGQYFGASLTALRHLADERGYEFIGTNSNGINAFFVRRDLAHHVLPLLEEIKAFPSRHRDARSERGEMLYTAGTARYDLISHLPVIDVTTGKELPLRDLGPAFSDEWLWGMEQG